MNTPDTTVPPPWLMSKNVLAEGGVDGVLHWFGPGAEHTESDPDAARARVVFVTGGSLIVALGITHHIVAAERTLHLPPGRPAVFRNPAEGPAKALVLTLPEQRPPPSTLFSFPSVAQG